MQNPKNYDNANAKNKAEGSTVKLRVAEAIQIDVGRNIARLQSSVMDRLGLNAGDVIEIIGKSKAVASVWRARPEDEDKDIIRIDGNIRFNASVSLGEEVSIRKTECSPAKTVVLAPVEAVQFSSDPTEFFHHKLLDRPLLKGQKLEIDIMGTQLYYVVVKLSPNKCARVVHNTKLVVSDEVVKAESLKMPEVSYEDIGGLRKEIDMIREMVEIPMKHPEVFNRLGIGAPKGVLLTGPPGTGKTLLAKAVASESDANFYSIAGPEIMSKFYGESEKQLRDVFEKAEKNAPSVIFIDEIDAIAPKRDEAKGEVERRVVAQLLTLLDGIKSRGQVVVMAATNRPDDIDIALRRPGRFDREIRINPPNEKGRKEILQIHTRGMPLAKDVDLDYIARKTKGFTGADLEMLCKEAGMKALRPYLPGLKNFDDQVPSNVLEKLEVRMKHFKDALGSVEPSAMREVLITKPHVKWSDIGGLDDAKQKIKEVVEWPLKDPETFKKFGISPAKGILLYGPPGTGKTLLAKAVATESDANFIAVKGPELITKWVGESEKKIREIFSKAKQVKPTIIFFDEFDSISKIRGTSLSDVTEKVVAQLLTELDGIEELEKVVVIAATNRPDLIDEALLRPGRIDLKIEIGLPDEKSREEIFRIHTKGMPLAGDVDIKWLVKQTEGRSGAEISALCREAAMQAMREYKAGKAEAKVGKRHFEHAFAALNLGKSRKKDENNKKNK